MKYKQLVAYVFLEIIFSSVCVAEEALKTISIPHWVNSATFGKSGRQLIARGKNLIVLDALKGDVIKRIQTKSFIVSLNGDYFVRSGAGETLEVRRVDTEELINTFLGFSDRKYTQKEIDRFINRIYKPQRKIEEFSRTNSVAITPDGRYLAACSISDFMIRLWDVKSGVLIKERDMRTHEMLENRCKEIISSPDGKYFAVNDATSLAHLLNATTGETLKTFRSDFDMVAHAFSGNGNILAIADKVGRINLWDINRNKILQTIHSNSGIGSVSLSSNGEYLASVASLQNIKLWNAKTGKLIKTFEGHSDNIISIFFSPDDKFIASAGYDNKIKVWDVGGGIIAQKNINARLPGIVYKSKSFWQSFIGFDKAKETFQGEFSGLTSNTEFMLHYGNFQSVYYNTCKSNLPSNSVLRGYSSQVVVSDGWGNEKYREQPIEHKIYIDPRFVDKYDEYYDRANTYMAQQTLKKVWAMQNSIRKGLKKYKATLSGATAEAIKEYLANEPIIQMMRFFQNTGCNSATMYQMRENLWRAAHSKPSLQVEGVRIPNAEQESVSVEALSSQKTIYQACIDSNLSSYSIKDYCSCFSKEARKVMTMKELSYFSEDFSRYRNDVLAKLESQPPATDHAWVLYKPKYNCM